MDHLVSFFGIFTAESAENAEVAFRGISRQATSYVLATELAKKYFFNGESGCLLPCGFTNGKKELLKLFA